LTQKKRTPVLLEAGALNERERFSDDWTNRQVLGLSGDGKRCPQKKIRNHLSRGGRNAKNPSAEAKEWCEKMLPGCSSEMGRVKLGHAVREAGLMTIAVQSKFCERRTETLASKNRSCQPGDKQRNADGKSVGRKDTSPPRSRTEGKGRAPVAATCTGEMVNRTLTSRGMKKGIP